MLLRRGARASSWDAFRTGCGDGFRDTTVLPNPEHVDGISVHAGSSAGSPFVPGSLYPDPLNGVTRDSCNLDRRIEL